MLASTMVPSRSHSPWDSRWASISSNRPLPRPCRSRRWRKFRMVVSSGRASDRLRPTETPDRFGLVEQILHAGVAQVVEQLHAVNPQHHRQRVGPAALARLGIYRPDALLQPLPRNQAVHALQEQLAAGPALLALVFQVRESRLVHQFSLRPVPAVPAILCHNHTDLFRASLALLIGLKLKRSNLYRSLVVGEFSTSGIVDYLREELLLDPTDAELNRQMDQVEGFLYCAERINLSGEARGIGALFELDKVKEEATEYRYSIISKEHKTQTKRRLIESNELLWMDSATV